MNIAGMIEKVKDDHEYILRHLDMIDHCLNRSDSIRYTFLNTLVDNLLVQVDAHIFIEGTIFQGALKKANEDRMKKYLDLYAGEIKSFGESYECFSEVWKNQVISQTDLRTFISSFSMLSTCVRKRIRFENNDVMDAVMEMMTEKS